MTDASYLRQAKTEGPKHRRSPGERSGKLLCCCCPFATNLKSLRTELPSESFLAAAEPVLLFRFTSETMKDLYARCPPMVDFGKKLLEMLAIEQEEQLDLFRLYSAEERFRYFEENRPQILQRVPLSYLASYLGVARETLSRFRKK